MENLIMFENQSGMPEVITSLELLVQINLFRKIEGGKSKLPHKTLLRTIRDEFDKEINERKIVPVKYKDKKGEYRDMYELTLNQAKQVLARESKTVRRGVFEYIEKLENNIKCLLVEKFNKEIQELNEEAEEMYIDIEKLSISNLKTKRQLAKSKVECNTLNSTIQLQKIQLSKQISEIRNLKDALDNFGKEEFLEVKDSYKSVAEVCRMFGRLYDARPLISFSNKNSLPIIWKYDCVSKESKRAYHPKAWSFVYDIYCNQDVNNVENYK